MKGKSVLWCEDDSFSKKHFLEILNEENEKKISPTQLYHTVIEEYNRNFNGRLPEKMLVEIFLTRKPKAWFSKVICARWCVIKYFYLTSWRLSQ